MVVRLFQGFFLPMLLFGQQDDFVIAHIIVFGFKFNPFSNCYEQAMRILSTGDPLSAMIMIETM